MTDSTQPEALRLADELEFVSGGWGVADQCCAELRRQHARIAELESELEAVGAGGVRNLPIGAHFILKRTGDRYELLGHKRDTPGGTQYVVRRSGFANPTTLHHSCHVEIIKNDPS